MIRVDLTTLYDIVPCVFPHSYIADIEIRFALRSCLRNLAQGQEINGNVSDVREESRGTGWQDLFETSLF
jgi:hypothetical protein